MIVGTAFLFLRAALAFLLVFQEQIIVREKPPAMRTTYPGIPKHAFNLVDYSSSHGMLNDS
jgi:hypothetical protein